MTKRSSWAEMAALAPSFDRKLVRLQSGEVAPRTLLQDAPDGYRFESDAELRQRIAEWLLVQP